MSARVHLSMYIGLGTHVCMLLPKHTQEQASQDLPSAIATLLILTSALIYRFSITISTILQGTSDATPSLCFPAPRILYAKISGWSIPHPKQRIVMQDTYASRPNRRVRVPVPGALCTERSLPVLIVDLTHGCFFAQTVPLHLAHARTAMCHR